MVKRRYQKKHITTSSDESDTDEFYEEEPDEVSKPKKYSLRQRKEANFAEDFDYDALEENDTNVLTGTEVLRSDDEDFELGKAQKQESSDIVTKNSSKPKITAKVNQVSATNCIITKCKDRELEPDIPKNKQSCENMIDFEDIIRADVLVNKSKIDYDSIIEKTEIKIEKKPEVIENEKNNEKSIKLRKNGEPAKKRGRRSKKIFSEDSYRDDYESQTFEETESTGLPINTVLGVTESLYELAERYHLQGGIIEPLPMEPILHEDVPAEHSKTAFLGDDHDVSLQQVDPASGVIEIY
ncbi:uncharacterized protein LOC123323014 [Coccinella septempunctata]|uniref:uncharacterized protein LOC123323014 n=1 Tax=Coccinella septempunctata TaxID=41139 RepID=UPI001D092714|nr:uncharacterized protein LOC123323014 [Coccinella septempunctata]